MNIHNFGVPLRPLLRLAVLTASVHAAAQTSTQTPVKTAAPDPTDAKAKVPALVYTPVLADYKKALDEAPLDWRQANDTARALGGWRAYARDAAQAPPGAPASTPPAAASQAPPTVAKPTGVKP
jgi:hypothetical protein